MEAAAPLAFFNHRVQHCRGLVLETDFVHHLESAISDFKRLVESTKAVGLPATLPHIAEDAEAEVVVVAELEKPSEPEGNAEVVAEVEVRVEDDTVAAETGAAVTNTAVGTVPEMNVISDVVEAETEQENAGGTGNEAVDVDMEKARDGEVEVARVVAESGNEAAVAGMAVEAGDLGPDGGTGGGVIARGGSHPPSPSTEYEAPPSSAPRYVAYVVETLPLLTDVSC